MAGRGWPGMGSGRGGHGKIAGVDVPWEYDAELKIDTKPSELFPPNPPPIAPPPRRDEKLAVARYRALRERIHEGPLYTVLGDQSRVSKSRTSATSAVVLDPFEGMPTYGQKYKKQRRKIPRLDTRPYVMRFFPEELWTTLDPTTKPGANAAALKKRRKMLKIALSTKLTRLEELEEDGDLGGRDDDDDDLEKEDEDNAGPEAEEEQDDDFEEDEDDDDDYNAENYFDNGEDDDYGDEGGGGGDDYDF
ncbi:DNA-directed RNA polymerase III, subunit Rpc31 [Macrophomina phaseolina]|uniref:DNA-directed RNA polymerase III subunit n=1 Tax=Macrophomina phaseolina TaxID=35725 RepID=A0ABQ8G6W2_9PEZI|nr:DNA-directed RNA polymerase III, subunit Rpc31 [Macrophomina phaseolina]